MEKIQKRLPSIPDLLAVSGLAFLLDYSWTFYNAFDVLPSWLKIYLFPELVGLLAYLLSIALLDTVLAVGGAVGLGLLLPRPWFVEDFAAKGGVTVIAIWISSLLINLPGVYLHHINHPTFLRVVLVDLLCVGSLFVMLRIPFYRRLVRRLAERSTVFVYVYLPLGLLGVLIVAVRNLFYRVLR
jgi:hypothetical protein